MFNLEIFFSKNMPTIIIAMCGGFASLIIKDEAKSIRKIFAELFLAAFVGFLVGVFCLEKGAPIWLTCMACGTAGLSSERILFLIQGFVLKIMPYGPTNTNFKNR